MFASLGFWVMVADVPSADLYGKILAVFGGMYGGLGLILHDRDMTR